MFYPQNFNFSFSFYFLIIQLSAIVLWNFKKSHQNYLIFQVYFLTAMFYMLLHTALITFDRVEQISMVFKLSWKDYLTPISFAYMSWGYALVLFIPSLAPDTERATYLIGQQQTFILVSQLSKSLIKGT